MDTATGSLAPIRQGEDSTMIALSFTDNENTPELLMRQGEMLKVNSEVQTKENFMRGYTKHADLGNTTTKWQYFTHKREPRRLSQNIASFEPVPQKFQKWGMSASKYGDEAWITRYPMRKSKINVPKTILMEMEKGFLRLQIRQAFAAMLNQLDGSMRMSSTDTARIRGL